MFVKIVVFDGDIIIIIIVIIIIIIIIYIAQKSQIKPRNKDEYIMI